MTDSGRLLAPLATEPVLCGASPVAIELQRAVERSAAARSVVVRGPHGSGRRGLARALHAAGGSTDGPCLEARCPGLTGTWGLERLLGTAERPGLLESARGGTLVLVGLEELEAEHQEVIAEALAHGSFTPLGARAPRPLDLRLVALTYDEELERLLASEELAYRLNEHQIELPPLAARSEDLASIAAAVLERLDARATLDDDAREHLASMHFIGGFDDFVEWIGSAWSRADGGPLRAEHLAERAPGLGSVERPDPLAAQARGDALPLGDRAWRTVEKSLIELVLDECEGNRSRAARALGFNRSTLYNKLRHYGIDR